MKTEDLEELILQELRAVTSSYETCNIGLTTWTLTDKLSSKLDKSLPRRTVDSIMNGLSRRGRVQRIQNRKDKHPNRPVWHLTSALLAKEDKSSLMKTDIKTSPIQIQEIYPARSSSVYLLIDLRRIHDILPEAEKQIKWWNVWVFTHQTTLPTPPQPGVRVISCPPPLTHETGQTNYMGLCLVWEISRLVFDHRGRGEGKVNTQLHFIVATRDKRLRGLQQQVQEEGHTLSWVNTWDEAIPHLLSIKMYGSPQGLCF